MGGVLWKADTPSHRAKGRGIATCARGKCSGRRLCTAKSRRTGRHSAAKRGKGFSTRALGPTRVVPPGERGRGYALPCVGAVEKLLDRWGQVARPGSQVTPGESAFPILGNLTGQLHFPTRFLSPSFSYTRSTMASLG